MNYLSMQTPAIQMLINHNYLRLIDHSCICEYMPWVFDPSKYLSILKKSKIL